MMNARGLRIFFAGLCAAFFAAGVAGCVTVNRGVSIPVEFARAARALPAECRQAVFVKGERETSRKGRLWLLERGDASSAWVRVSGPFPVDLGRNGMAWGRGDGEPGRPVGFRMKREGDGCSPEGVFRVPFAFGYAAQAPGVRLKYVRITETMAGVDDPQSRYYNQLVDSRAVARDWGSAETMLRADGIYRWGIFVAHNPGNVPGGGSCIFMHIWYGPGHGTSGCTAMAEGNLLRVLRWLDPAKEPRVVQCAGR